MANLLRFGVSIEKKLLHDFDGLIEKKGYANRSDALRSLIRSHLLAARTEETPDLQVIGTITLVYDHGSGDLPARLTEMQHRYHQSIVSTLHVHFEEHSCLEVLVVRGRQKDVCAISDSLIGTRGVQQGKLIINAGVEAEEHRVSGHATATHRHKRMT